MRYNCPSCNRVFYLDAKTVSPCPACGSMLQMQSDDAPADAATPAADAGGADAAWAGDSSQEDATVVQPSVSAPAGTGTLPSASSWLSPGALDSVGDDMALQSMAYAPAADDQMAGAPSIPEPVGASAAMAAAPAMSPSATGGYRTGGMRAQRAPNGTKIFLITAVAMIAAFGVAIVIVLVAKPDIMKGKQPVAPVPTVNVSEEEANALRAQLNTEKDKLAEVLRSTGEARQALEAQIQVLQADVAKLRGGVAHVVDSSAMTVKAVSLLERRSDLAGALNQVSAALKKDARFAPAHTARGRILAAMGRADEALGAFEAADSLSAEDGRGNDAMALLLAGEVCLTDLGDKQKAGEFYAKAAKADPEGALGKVAAARAAYLGSKWEVAGKLAEEAQNLSPSLPLASLLLGEVEYEKAMLKSESERKALLNNAGKLLAEAVRLDPNSARACLMYGRTLIEEANTGGKGSFGVMRLGPQSKAERLLSRAMDLSPSWPEVHLALAKLRLDDGALRDPAMALSRASEAVRLTDRKDAIALATLAAAQAATGSPSQALTTIGEALKIEPQNKSYQTAKNRYASDAKALRRR